MRKKKILVIFIGLLFLNFINTEKVYFNLADNSLRRIKFIQIPEEYQDVVEQLNHDDPAKRIEAINEIKEIIINKEKNENIKKLLSLKIAEKLNAPVWDVYKEAIKVLGEIISSLKEELAKGVTERLSDFKEGLIN
jgi:hypothetical protein